MIGRLPDPREKPWLTVAELAAITGEGEKAIRAALAAGQLPMLPVGRYVRIPTAPLLQQLGIDLDNSEAGDSTSPATAQHSIDTTEGAVSHECAHDTSAESSNLRVLPSR
jgi:hypothetical protein